MEGVFRGSCDALRGRILFRERCLNRTRFLIRCRIDNDPNQEEASRVLDLMAFYVGKCGAVLYLEDEGFFTDSDTPLLGWCVGDED